MQRSIDNSYKLILGKHLEDPLPEPTPEPTFAEEHSRLSAEIAAIQTPRMGKIDKIA